MCNSVQTFYILFRIDQSELMLTERTKMMIQERSKAPTVQSLTDKMSRLTHRKPHNSKLLLNELTSDTNVTNNNHSTTRPSEGKTSFPRLGQILTS